MPYSSSIAFFLVESPMEEELPELANARALAKTGAAAEAKGDRRTAVSLYKSAVQSYSYYASATAGKVRERETLPFLALPLPFARDWRLLRVVLQG